MKCAYRACGKSRSPGLSIYSFPVKDKERCKRWIINSGNPLDIPLYKYEIKGLCGDHFIKEDFVNETKHRLIQMAVPKHYTDPLGHARRKERGLDVEEDRTSVNNNIQVFSLSEKLQRDLENMQMNESNGRLVVSSNLNVGEKEDNEGDPDEQQSIPLRHDLFNGNCKIQWSKKDKKIKCYVRQFDKRDNLGGSTSKLHWLEKILKEAALNKKKNSSYYININDLLNSFEESESSDFTDLEFGWYASKNKEKIKCYSRKNNTNEDSSRHFPSESNRNEDTTTTSQGIKDENKNAWINKSDVSSSSNILKSEVEDYKDGTDMLLSSEYEFMNQDVKDEGISECQLQWSEEEDDKSYIRIVDISKLQTERSQGESKTMSPLSRMYKRKVGCKRRFTGGMKNIIRTTETEKIIYIMNRNRLQIHNLKNKLRKCHKELNKLRKSKPALGR